jgi:hypothetical protein
MSSINFELCNDISCNDYDATAVLYVSLSTFRDIFKFETTEITNNALPATTLTQANADITYYVNSSSFPVINPAHAMMDVSGSEGITFTSPSSQSNLLKHDFIYYLGKSIIGHATLIGLFNNITEMKIELENMGWSHKEYTETIFTDADNSGNGLTNTGINPDYENLTKRILEQIKYHEATRLKTNRSFLLNKQILENINHIVDGSSINTNKNNSITLQNVTTSQQITTTATTLNGSLFTYTPPDNSTHIIYEFTSHFTWDNTTSINGEDAIIKLTAYIDSSQSNNPEYIHLKNLTEITHTHKQIIDTSDPSWSSGKTIEIKAQVLNSNYSALAHFTNLLAQSVIKPKLKLVALGSNQSENEIDNIKSRILEKIMFISNGSIYPTNKNPSFTTPNINTAISVPTTLTSLYSINYTPPDDTKYIKFSFIAKMTWNDTSITINGHDSLLVWGIYVNNTLVNGTLKQVRVGNLIEEDHIQEYTFDIQSDSSWFSGKTIEIKGYSIYTDYPVKIFFTNHTQTLVQPKVEITSLGDSILPTNRVNPTIYRGQILEKIHQLTDGTNGTTNVTASQTIPISTLTDINGSSIDYIPPTDTERIIVKFKAFATWNDQNTTINGPDSIMKWSIYVDNQEITQSIKYIHIGNLIEEYYTQEYVFDISSNYSNQEAEGKFSSWTTSKNIKIKGFSIYNGENPVKLHYSNVETAVVKPKLTIISIGTSPIVRDEGKIQNTTSIQSVPLIEGDSINYYWTLKHNNIPDRKYRIKLHLTDNTNNTNTIPTDSIANTSEYPNITSHGVPTF